MDWIKKITAASLISITMTSVFANKMMVQDRAVSHEVENWQFKTQDDGLFFLLGTYSKKLLKIHVNEKISSGGLVDPVIVLCNKVDENEFREHRLEAGMTLTCKGNFQDTASMYITKEDFKNGAEGIYVFKPV